MELKIKKINASPRFRKLNELTAKRDELMEKVGELFEELIGLALVSQDEKMKDIAVRIEGLTADVGHLEDDIRAEQERIEENITSTIEETLRSKFGIEVEEDEE